MMRSMFSGVAGLKAHQVRMDTIGNNIANVNTVGYKGSRVTFQDTLNQTLRLASGAQSGRGGVNPEQVGLGVSLASIDVLQTQGNLQNTGKVTDLAIQGDGFFVVSDGTRQFYTRAGAFTLETSGKLVYPSNGMVVQGWMANNGAIDNTAQVTDVTLPVGQTIAPITTANVSFKYNLNSQDNGTISLGPNPQTVVDNAGNSMRTTFVLTPTGNFNEWNWSATVANGTITSGTGTGVLRMNSDGTVAAMTGGDFQITSSTAGGQPVTVTLPLAGTNPNITTVQGTATTITGTYAAGAPPTLTYPDTTVTDSAGNTATLHYATVATGNPGEFTWTASAVGGTGTMGGTLTGTITVNTATGAVVSNTNTTPFTITPTNGRAIRITPPVVGATDALTVARVGGETFTGTYTAPTNPSVTSRVIDSLGGSHTVYTTLTKTANNSWDWTAKDETGTATYGTGSLTFDSSGTLSSSIGGPILLTPPGASAISITPNFDNLTQYASETTIASSSDGYPMGQLESFNIDNTGKIIGVFSNGLTQTLAQVAMASFRNPAGLTRSGDTMFSQSNNSGLAQVGAAATNGRGQITPGALEMSNVDLSQEFTDMITTERGFQANSKIITTSDEMLQDLVNLKR